MKSPAARQVSIHLEADERGKVLDGVSKRRR
jgi:hypothetical protein